MHDKHTNGKFDKGINSADVMLIVQLVINVGSEYMQLCASRSQTCFAVDQRVQIRSYMY